MTTASASDALALTASSFLREHLEHARNLGIPLRVELGERDPAPDCTLALSRPRETQHDAPHDRLLVQVEAVINRVR
jgi:hypothetical protein